MKQMDWQHLRAKKVMNALWNLGLGILASSIILSCDTHINEDTMARMAIKVIAYSLWGHADKYTASFSKNYHVWKRSNIDREMWVYFDDSIPPSFRRKHSSARWIEMPATDMFSGALWRFLSIDEADNVWCRDSDGILSIERNRMLDAQWESTGKRLGILRDHEFVGGISRIRKRIRAGSFNIKGCTGGKMLALLHDYQQRYWSSPYGADEHFLGRCVYPYFKHDCAVIVRNPEWQNQQHRSALFTHLTDHAMYAIAEHARAHVAGVSFAECAGTRFVSKARAQLIRLWSCIVEGTDRMPILDYYGQTPGSRMNGVYALGYKCHRILLACGAHTWLRYRYLRRIRAHQNRNTQHLFLPLVVGICAEESSVSQLYLSVYNIMRQSLAPTTIIVYVPQGISLPPELSRMRSRGVHIEHIGRTHIRRRALAKLVTAHPKSLCVFADGNVLYPRTWLEELYRTWRAHTESICAHSGRALSQCQPRADGVRYYSLDEYRYGGEVSIEGIVPTLERGVLLPPGAGAHRAWEDQKFSTLRGCDDVWLKALARAIGLVCHLVPAMPHRAHYLSGASKNVGNEDAHPRRAELAALLEYSHGAPMS